MFPLRALCFISSLSWTLQLPLTLPYCTSLTVLRSCTHLPLWCIRSLVYISCILVTVDLRTVRIRSHSSNTTRNSSEFPRYVYLLVIRFPETPDFPIFSISGKLWNSNISNFQKLQTPTFSEIFILCNSPCFMSSPFTGDSVRSR